MCYSYSCLLMPVRKYLVHKCLHWPINHYLRMNGNNEKNDFIEIIKISMFLIFMATLYSLYKFNFDFSKVKILSILKWYPASFICVLVGFYLSRFLKNSR